MLDRMMLCRQLSPVWRHGIQQVWHLCDEVSENIPRLGSVFSQGEGLFGHRVFRGSSKPLHPGEIAQDVTERWYRPGFEYFSQGKVPTKLCSSKSLIDKYGIKILCIASYDVWNEVKGMTERMICAALICSFAISTSLSAQSRLAATNSWRDFRDTTRTSPGTVSPRTRYPPTE
ncbi:hypothetical protein [Paeniglutamicibacter psychrophenolicus]|uniref:Uncharacterized protein n=1 Tax=Paeniglutamicibacter psychrophenolicus TaxID=257454 RepID=A0ABS4WAY2_9MICC|nr:hypothetical protein [Paeniglutamicibacter psychrophenolicus]MBP2373330.1 hypothetical protein [Paeniglutamicibacter psychrophenolicus]